MIKFVRYQVARGPARIAFALFLLCPSIAAALPAGPLRLEVINSLDQARPHEVLALPLDALRRRRPGWVPNALTARIVGQDRYLPVQPYASGGEGAPDQLLVLLDLPAHGRLALEILAAAHAPHPLAGCLHGRNVPERDDDFAWENEQVAYRIYGPALQAKGEGSSGIDVWSKRPVGCALDDWYRRDAAAQRLHDPALSYHRDNGVGLDSYAVGASPGDGGTAAWVDGHPVYSQAMQRARVTAAGPVRLRFEVDYAPWRAGDSWVNEHKVITLDAGSHMNQQEVRYRVDGASRLVVAAGLAAHVGAQPACQGDATLAVWDIPQRADAGRIATGLFAWPADASKLHSGCVEADKALWLLFDVGDGEVIHFASGAGWSKGDMPDFATWQRYLAVSRLRAAHPLRWHWLVP